MPQLCYDNSLFISDIKIIMSIRREGTKSEVYVVCKTTIKLEGTTLQEGQKYILVNDLGTLYVLLSADGQEILAPKELFKDSDI